MKRSKRKGPFIIAVNTATKNNKLVILNRNIEITSKIVGLNCQVYNGRKLVSINITEEMVGHKLGEFSPTREKFIFKKKKKK